MELSAHGLRLEIDPIAQAEASDDWGRVRVRVQVNGFEGSFEAWLQPIDLSRFAQELNSLYLAPGQVASAKLASAEPDVEVVLTMQRLGGITGRYRLESERPNGVPTVLSGGFELDQSYLPGLRQSVESLAQALSPNHVP